MRNDINKMKPYASDTHDHSTYGILEDQPPPNALEDDGRSKIYYLCPDTLLPSAGIRRLYRHVALLNNAGFSAAILHMQKGFHRKDLSKVPIEYLDGLTLESDAIVVIPEGLTSVMNALKGHSGRRFVIALNWDYVYKNMPDGMDWRNFNIDGVLVISPTIGRMIAWSMGLPVHLISSGIDHQRYHYNPDIKRPQLAFIKRKGINIDQLKRMIGARNIDYIHKIEWIGLDGLSEDDYAAQICKSAVFVNASLAEGYPTSCLEAMAAGTLVAGYNSVGGRDILCGQGSGQNCILAPNGNYTALAYALEPVLNDLIQGKMENWDALITSGLKITAGIRPENESASLIAFWRKVCSDA